MGSGSENLSVVLITVDCLRSDHVGCYGYNRDTTPNIDSLAEGGTRFKTAYSNGPGTRFAFKSLNAGTYPLRIHGAGLPHSEGVTLAEHLSSNGYQTAAFANNPFLTRYFNYDRGYDTFVDVNDWASEPSASGLILERLNRFASKISQRLSDGVFYRTLKTVYGNLMKTAEAQGAHVGATDSVVISHALDWIKSAQASYDPYFVWIHLMDAHHPYQYFPDIRKTLGITKERDHIRNPTNIIDAGSAPPQAVIDAYDVNIRSADMQIGRLMNVISEDTLTIVTGDHGEEFGEHNQFHVASVYESMSRVPLIIHGKSFPSTTIREIVSHVDIPKTIGEIGSGNCPEYWDGNHLLEDINREHCFLGFEDPEGIVGGIRYKAWKYIGFLNNFDDLHDEQLYNLDEDPTETRDCKDTEVQTLVEMREVFRDYLDDIRDDRLQAQHPIWDANHDLKDTVMGSPSESEKREIDKQLEYLGYK